MSRLETITSGAALRVDVTAIREEMRSLWKTAAAESSGSAVTRACLLNLVVWSTDPARRGEMAGMIACVVEEIPARVLLMEVDPADGGERLEAWISAHCRVPAAGAKQVCSEQVTLRASASSAKHLPGLLSGLTSGELPVCLYAAQPPDFQDAAFLRIIGYSDRLILDSARLATADLRILTTLDTGSSPTAVSDLNWPRLRPFQEMIAGFFDAPLFRRWIPGLRRMESAGGPGSETSARLLAGWIRAAVRGLSLPLRHREDADHPPGRLAGVRLHAEGAEGAVQFVVERAAGTGCLVGRVEMEGTCPVPRRLRPRDLTEWELLAGLLERAGRDSLYEAALSRALEND